MRLSGSVLCAAALVALAACGSDETTSNTGPVTYVPVAPVNGDSIDGRVIL